MTHFLDSLRNWLLNPHPRVTNAEKIQRSRLLSTILLVLILIVALILTIVLLHDFEDINEPTVQGAILLLGISILMYILNRLGYTSIPAMGVILPFIATFIYIPFYSGEDPVFLAFLMIPIIFTAIFFSLRWTTITSAGILILVAILLAFVDQSPEDTPYWNLRNMWFFLMLATGLVLTFMWHLGKLEQIRQLELKRINEQLEQKIAELERFTYTVSHELKSPIVTVKGFLGSIEKDLRDGRYEQAQNDIPRVLKAADKMRNTLSDLLELSRVGRITNPFEEFELSQLVREALETVDGQLRSHNVAVNLVSDLPVIYGDHKRLHEVFENLIDNAAKYMGDQKHPLIEIGMKKGKEPIFFVKDNGMGIEPQFQTKIFGLFDKLDPTSDGTGVGLALIKRIIETHGGRIWVESEGSGKGSTFYFTIPDNRDRRQGDSHPGHGSHL
jgi:signal transduction histidine kinase